MFEALDSLWAGLVEDFYTCFIEKNRWKYLVTGLENTLLITFFALLIGVVIGIVISIVRSTYAKNYQEMKPGFGKKVMAVANWFCGVYLTMDVYYRIYLENMDGGLAEMLEITIKDGRGVLYSGKAAGLIKEKAKALDRVLHVDETAWLSVAFYLPKDAGNIAQKTEMLFNICADAVQTKNNPDKLFE